MKFKLTEWAHVAEIIGAVAIIISLLYVSIQMKDTTRAIKSTATNDAAKERRHPRFINCPTSKEEERRHPQKKEDTHASSTKERTKEKRKKTPTLHQLSYK